MVEDKTTDVEVELSIVDKETIDNMVNSLMGFMKPPAEGDSDTIFDNKTLDSFTKNFVIMLGEIRKDGNLTKHIRDGELELEVPIVIG